MKKICFVFLLISLFVVPLPSFAQSQTLHHEWVYTQLPITDSSVSTSGDYSMYLLSTQLSSSPDFAVSNYLRLDGGIPTGQHNPFMHAGLYVTSQGVGWFAGTNPGDPRSPTVSCANSNHEVWFNPSGEPTGCLSPLGHLGLTTGIWTRLQFVTYGNGTWIVRFTQTNGSKVDVATIANPHPFLTGARVVMEETWQGSQNPWLSATFYNLDLKYRVAGTYGNPGGWTHWPSNIGGGYGSNSISELSTSGSDPCPSHYGINTYIQGNPYLWYMGSGGSTCSGLLYTGGGPSTTVISIASEPQGKFMSSENGVGCVKTDRTNPLQWEEWHVIDLSGNVKAFRGNNGKHMKRGSGDDLFVNDSSFSNNNTKYDYIQVAPYVFFLRNKGNNRYVDHNAGSGCTEADSSSQGSQEKFRYVAW